MSEPRLPIKEDIRQLPRWARVAFAARCARRALLRQARSQAPTEHIGALDKAVSLAERYAAAAKTTTKAAAIRAAQAALVQAVAHTDAQAAAHAAASAAHTAHTYDATNAARAAATAQQAGVAVTDLWRDFSTILELTRQQKWDDNTPVPPSVFGPLDTPSKGHQLEIELEVPDDWTEEQIRAYVAELSDRLDDVHRAAGGHGLKVHDLDILSDAGIPAGVRQ